MNHYPLPTARKLPAHAVEGDTALSTAAITCPCCRENLKAKIEAHRSNAAYAKMGSQTQVFEASVANQWQAVLDQTA